MADKARRKGRQKREDAKPRLPETLRAMGDEAIERHERRLETPELAITAQDGSWSITSPFAAVDLNHWAALLYDAFGTRSKGACWTFIQQLCRLCSQDWNDADEAWHPNQSELIAAVQIVRSTQPENEAQACIAAQMVALHFTAMRLGGLMSTTTAPDERTAATLARVSRAYGSLAHTLAQLQGKIARREVNQTIQVVYVDNRDQRSVTVGGGYPGNGGQPHRATGGAAVPCAALPSPSERIGEAMLLPGREGEAGLPRPRWRERIRRAVWGG